MKDPEKHLGEAWARELKPLLDSDHMDWLIKSLRQEYTKLNYDVLPNWSAVFKAFRDCPFDKVRVVIIGMSPYNNGKATGVAFANEDSELRRSKTNLAWERCMESDFYFGNGFSLNFDPTLKRWSDQGVLMLNVALTTVAHNPYHHHVKYWKGFFTYVLRLLTKSHPGLVIIPVDTLQFMESWTGTVATVLPVSSDEIATSHVLGKTNDIIYGQNGLKEDAIKWDASEQEIFYEPF